MKWPWKFNNEEQSYLKEVIKVKYAEEDNCMTKEVTTPYGVSLWRSIRSLWSEFKANTKIKMGNGEKTEFWKDVWNEAGRLESELDYNGEDQSMSPRPPPQHSQPLHFTNSGFHVSPGPVGVATPGHGLRSDHGQQPKNNVFSNALSSPVRRSLQNYHIAQGSHFSNNAQPPNATRHNETNSQHQNRDSNGYNSADASMDMHSDSPGHDSTY
ncbi:hypothetical protein MTR67_050639 [Solanum verrucosum]|uniref:Uncharacterized protein n=1 Tax=Solanum verrucosum TaxID=315347 RepID=A0AAF0V4W9_SOLVR|nr:hypothetical protein MTR67_050639 [Solanum verrucosum]